MYLPPFSMKSITTVFKYEIIENGEHGDSS